MIMIVVDENWLWFVYPVPGRIIIWVRVIHVFQRTDFPVYFVCTFVGSNVFLNSCFLFTSCWLRLSCAADCALHERFDLTGFLDRRNPRMCRFEDFGSGNTSAYDTEWLMGFWLRYHFPCEECSPFEISFRPNQSTFKCGCSFQKLGVVHPVFCEGKCHLAYLYLNPKEISWDLWSSPDATLSS